MSRTTITQIRAKVKELRNYTDIPIAVHSSYGRYSIIENGSEISPNLPAGELMDWLRAWGDGFTRGKRSCQIK